MNGHRTAAVALVIAVTLHAQQPPESSFGEAAAATQQRLEQSMAELDRLRQRIADEKIPLSKELDEREGELSRLRAEFQAKSRDLNAGTLELSNLRSEIKARQEEGSYLSNLFGEFLRGFESRLRIAERQRYDDVVAAAKLAPENSNLTQEQVWQAQSALVAAALERLDDALEGSRFEGTAVDPDGVVTQGTFAMVGPTVLFRSGDGRTIGTAEQRLGSEEPAVIPFSDPADAAAAAAVVESGSGALPFDPTLGNAHKIEATHESVWEHIQKGGPVMVPIFALAGAALLVALFKWLSLVMLRSPSRRRVHALLEQVEDHDVEGAREQARRLRGPVGRMLRAGVDHLGEPRELIEEVMFEVVLTTKLKAQRLLPFVAIAASSAPLLGLLGTVTGIIKTFKQITVFGSSDVKSLSGGISEALITTEFGLIVAIPALLLHAYLSRKARSVVESMETNAVALLNQIGKSPSKAAERPARVRGVADADVVHAQVADAQGEMPSETWDAAVAVAPRRSREGS